MVALVLLLAAIVAVLPSQARRDLSEELTVSAIPTTIGQVSRLYISYLQFWGFSGRFCCEYNICCNETSSSISGLTE